MVFLTKKMMNCSFLKRRCFTSVKKVLITRAMRKFIGDEEFLLGEIQHQNFGEKMLLHYAYEVLYFLIEYLKTI